MFNIQLTKDPIIHYREKKKKNSACLMIIEPEAYDSTPHILMPIYLQATHVEYNKLYETANFFILQDDN